MMSVDNQTVFDYVDRMPEKITEPGYFGVTVTRGRMKLSYGIESEENNSDNKSF